MFKKIYLLFGFLISVYLLLPSPKLPPPDLPESIKSMEPGDTVQIPNVSAYFTDKSRQEILNFYTDYFSKSFFLGVPLPTFRLNHPPEYAKQIIRDTTQSYYFEEVVHPFRESLFINGFEWENDVFTPLEARSQNAILVDGKVWKSKVTLRWRASNFIVRLIVFWLEWGMLWTVLSLWKKELRKAKKKRRHK